MFVALFLSSSYRVLKSPNFMTQEIQKIQNDKKENKKVAKIL